MSELKHMIQLYADFTWDEYLAYEAETSLLIFPRFEMINVINSHMTPLTPKPDPISIQHIKNMERIRKRLAEE